MTPNLLILGGTTEAMALCRRLAEDGLPATLSLAGRVANPKTQLIPTRIGGFGSVQGLRDFLVENAISHVIDATHPFAAQMSRNAVDACTASRVPLAALVREPWASQPADRWTHVGSIVEAAKALDRPAKRVFLAVGRLHLHAFAQNPQHHYVLRLVDPPNETLPFPSYDVIVDRGPFDIAGDRRLLETHQIELLVSKNSGGVGAQAKLIAAREMGFPVVMIDRPQMPARTELYSVQAVMDWLAHHSMDRGV